ncbi:MAG: hypothetical protein NVS3B21_03060 [Acidimicrobiales bacterium]
MRVASPANPRVWASSALSRFVDRLLCPLVDLVVVLGVGASAGRLSWPSVTYAALVVVVLAMGSIERHRLRPTVGDDIPGLVRAVSIPLLVLAPWLVHNPHGSAVLGGAPVTLVLLALGRLITHTITGAVRRRGLISRPTIIVGGGEIGQRLSESFDGDPSFGLRPIGFLEDDPMGPLPHPLLGATDDLPEVLTSTGAQRVVVAYGSAKDAQMVSILRACDDANVSLHVLPRFFELGVLPHAPEIDDVKGMQLVRLRRAALQRSSKLIKRSFDLVIAGTALVLVSPLVAVLALLVKRSGPGPVLFRQRRVGRGGVAFDVLKLRTMTMDPESDIQWGSAAQTRVTPIGAVLRRTSLDELPQLLNVIRGDMSLIGPRPERPHFAEIFGESIRGYNDRNRMASGLTGWSQVHGLRGDTSIADRAIFDNYYVENWSLWLDIRILVRTARAVVVDGIAHSCS